MSEFLRRKYRSYFRRLDVNKDGFLTRTDFEVLADRSCADEAPESPRRKTMRESYTRFYALIESLGSTPGKVSEEEWVEETAKSVNTPEYKRVLDDAIRICFALLDTNGDGYIQDHEYIRFFHSLRIPDHENVARIAFKTLDTSGSGELSLEEFRIAVTDFFYSEDESRPGTYYLGPLI